ncbi:MULTISPECIES: GNAT family N-acetyltransferase [Pseudomonas]|uniref:GNAT family N-acetyltransferase n=1 Tax=Pseudomonas alloputida TaxID=1940621 RepID=A0AAW7HX44_9PSED|nr:MULTISPECIES: GNAT family N-acetyltransferase [Pseudomonas]KMU96353.1 acetyltransferase [Pseudomonas putida]KMY28729.1 acetyltransferase [Pseudomonas putida]MBP2842139.1 GNAT family N-acetyltransferase [Pseudomonas sp. PNP]MDD2080650.1 GNAT family N-acetyltransferase [Pseudomonas putida]MDM3878544.1 GNAT family N-acetyltransferase [Pseudomonas alloputida]
MLDHFYRQHSSRMRAASDAELWVARAPGIIAGLSLSAVGEGFWLTGLFVAPQRRNQGVAARLVEAALAQVGGPVWLFCHPDLMPFYQRLGFDLAQQLPEALASRLLRYQRNKRLVALQRSQSSLTSSPGNSTSV